MKVVALVSGGKDSCYNMMQCRKYGHEIVALANLLPCNEDVDELDSYMYQTVGHQLVATYAECMGLPLFRKRITGKTRSKGLIYQRTDGDEVEDMEILLREVKRRFPCVEAVSTGAIASDYQRLRVENVCSRLGLVSLAFLWKRNQDELLQEMIDGGIHAVLVKVAVLGLNPKTHLGKDLASMKPHLDRLAELYGINVCGEGGEYETLTLDCPLFKSARIVIDEYEIRLHSLDSISSVGVLHPKSFHVEHKQAVCGGAENAEASPNDAQSRCGFPTLDLIEEAHSQVIDVDNLSIATEEGHRVNAAPADPAGSAIGSGTEAERGGGVCGNDDGGGVMEVLSWKQSSGYTLIRSRRRKHKEGDKLSSVDDSEATKQDLANALRLIEHELQACDLGWKHVLYIHLYLADMRHFVPANEVYKAVITEGKCTQGVPSRCTVEVPLKAAGGGNVMVDVLAANDESKRVLHVQSISPWAPSCIGPYSQATLHGGVLHMAGQIPLDPASMVIVKGGPRVEMARALLSCEAVAETFGVSLRRQLLCCTVYCASAAGANGREEMEAELRGFLHGVDSADGPHATTDYKVGKPSNCEPLIRYVVVSGLPKAALVEVQPVLVTLAEATSVHSKIQEEEEEEEEEEERIKSWALRRINIPSSVVRSSDADGTTVRLWKSGDDGTERVEVVDSDSILESHSNATTRVTEISCQGIAAGREVVCAVAFARERCLEEAAAVAVSPQSERSSAGADPNECECPSRHPRNSAHLWRTSIHSCVEKLGRALVESGFRWADVTVIRVYFVARHLELRDLETALTSSISSIACARDHCENGNVIEGESGIERSGGNSSLQQLPAKEKCLPPSTLPTAVLVPVEAVGLNASADAQLAIEITANAPR
ncbi:hypothetical protein CBR_g3613 [Chara braunii]|uniref:Diphthine--ammonia ligase n=1 Tax=Chara braunii TaxID=69332 RepID=A0A388KFT2_CHABU|nr:hypothetical protein CBR_g3613 [Chara braunii]|eukprot:GBG68914.1 hypothetical protein CBR_g3613 [Chara braunii]